jgi:hypothetical protein
MVAGRRGETLLEAGNAEARSRDHASDETAAQGDDALHAVAKIVS